MLMNVQVNNLYQQDYESINMMLDHRSAVQHQKEISSNE